MRPAVLKTLPRLLELIKLVTIIDILLSRAISHGIIEFTLNTTTLRGVVVPRSGMEDIIFEWTVRDTDGFVQDSSTETGYWVEKLGFFNPTDVEFFGPYTSIVNIFLTIVSRDIKTYSTAVSRYIHIQSSAIPHGHASTLCGRVRSSRCYGLPCPGFGGL